MESFRHGNLDIEESFLENLEYFSFSLVDELMNIYGRAEETDLE